MEEVSLAHVIVSALPSGYNRSRPHVFDLTRPDGSKTYVQVGTDALLEEWISTCNYWAARTSKEPLTGGVSNMDYGWGRTVFGEDGTRRASTASSGGDGDGEGEETIKARRKRTTSSASSRSAADFNSFVNEWKQPQHSTIHSTFDEETQFVALKSYKIKLEDEKDEHIAAGNGLVRHSSFLLCPFHLDFDSP
jgi:PH/SEC7 domain-containing protein